MMETFLKKHITFIKNKRVEVELKLIPFSYAGRVVIVLIFLCLNVTFNKFFFVLPDHDNANTGTDFL